MKIITVDVPSEPGARIATVMFGLENGEFVEFSIDEKALRRLAKLALNTADRLNHTSIVDRGEHGDGR